MIHRATCSCSVHHRAWIICTSKASHFHWKMLEGNTRFLWCNGSRKEGQGGFWLSALFSLKQMNNSELYQDRHETWEPIKKESNSIMHSPLHPDHINSHVCNLSGSQQMIVLSATMQRQDWMDLNFFCVVRKKGRGGGGSTVHTE